LLPWQSFSLAAMNPVDDSDLLLSELADFICPISGELMHDPVIADERTTIPG
jgi:hypothetical protein